MKLTLFCVFFQAGQLRNVRCEYSLHSEQEIKLSPPGYYSKLSKGKERKTVIQQELHVGYTWVARDMIAMKRWSETQQFSSWSCGRLTSCKTCAAYIPHGVDRFSLNVDKEKITADWNIMCLATDNLRENRISLYNMCIQNIVEVFLCQPELLNMQIRKICFFEGNIFKTIHVRF